MTLYLNLLPYFKIWIAPVLLTGALESSIVIINKNFKILFN